MFFKKYFAARKEAYQAKIEADILETKNLLSAAENTADPSARLFAFKSLEKDLLAARKSVSIGASRAAERVVQLFFLAGIFVAVPGAMAIGLAGGLPLGMLAIGVWGAGTFYASSKASKNFMKEHQHVSAAIDQGLEKSVAGAKDAIAQNYDTLAASKELPFVFVAFPGLKADFDAVAQARKPSAAIAGPSSSNAPKS